jgi:hypothetical protein
MTPGQVDLIRKSFDALWPAHRRLAEVFYGRFFELAPEHIHQHKLLPFHIVEEQPSRNAIWGQAIAFRRVRIYSRAETSLDYSLRCGAKRNDTCCANRNLIERDRME